MASTIAPIRAFDFSKSNIKGMPLDKIQVRLLDDVNKMMWMAAPWRWSVGTFAAITLTSNTSDYTQAPPGDFLYLIGAYVADGVSTPKHLEIVPTIPANIVVTGLPQFIAYQGSNTFRISPIPGTLIAPTKSLVMYYKKQAPTITAQNAMTAGTLVLDDEWFWVYEAGVLAMSYPWADDQRGGSVTIDSQGKGQYTGQRAFFESGLQMMREREPLLNLDFRAAQDQRESK